MKTYINCRQDMGSYTVCLFYSTVWLHEAIYFIKSILKITIPTQKEEGAGPRKDFPSFMYISFGALLNIMIY